MDDVIQFNSLTDEQINFLDYYVMERAYSHDELLKLLPKKAS
jgi:hypothetical protein